MTSFNESVSPAQRREWWTTTLGRCCVCGAALEFPMQSTVSGHVMFIKKSQVSSLLFKYDFVSNMENGHLIDRYIINNMRNLTAADIPEDAKLDIDAEWTVSDMITLTRLLDEADKHTVPVCKDCNIFMTNINSETVSTYYGLMRNSWFKDQRIPVETLSRKSRKLSTAKILEAVFLFFTLQPEPPKNEPIVIPELDPAGPVAIPENDIDAEQRASKVMQHVKKKSVTLEEANDFVGKPVGYHFKGHGFFTGRIESIKKDEDKIQFVVKFEDDEIKNYAFSSIKKHLLKSTAPIDGSESDSDSSSSSKKAKSALKRVTAGVQRLLRSGYANTDEGKWHWVLKTKEELWRDVCIMKTVSHLMQWGAIRHPRHRSLAIFWSAYYLWITFLSPSQQVEMSFHVWYVHVFRFYYMKLYPNNDWFSHDALTISQLTNVNAAMYTDDEEYALAPQWFDWVRKQLHVLQPDVNGLAYFVFLGDVSAFRIPELLVHIPRKENITQTLDLVRERTTDYETLLRLLYEKQKDLGITAHFEWFLFALKGMHNVTTYVREFKSDCVQYFKRSRVRVQSDD